LKLIITICVCSYFVNCFDNWLSVWRLSWLRQFILCNNSYSKHSSCLTVEIFHFRKLSISYLLREIYFRFILLACLWPNARNRIDHALGQVFLEFSSQWAGFLVWWGWVWGFSPDSCWLPFSISISTALFHNDAA